MASVFPTETLRTGLTVTALCVTAWFFPFGAVAQQGTDDPQIEAGHQLLQANRCDEAATTLRAAWQTGRRPRALAELGLAEACLSRWVDAETDLSQALATPDEWVSRARTTLDEGLGQVRRHLGTLIIEVIGPLPHEAEVHIDGQLRGRPGQELRAVAGTVVVEVRAQGFAAGRRSLEVPAGQRTRERFELARAATAPRAEWSPGTEDPAPLPTPGSRGTRRRSSGLQRTLGWVGLGVAGAFAATAVVGYLVRESNVEVWNDDTRCNSIPGLDRDQECPDEGSAWRTGEALVWVGVVGAGVTAAGAMTLLLTAPSAEPDSRFALSCGPVPGGGSCTLRVW